MKIAQLITTTTFILLCSSATAVHAQSAEQIKQVAVTGAQMAGGTARMATDVCQIDQERITAYKERARKAYAADDNFEGNWIIGWNDKQHAIDDIIKLETSNPDEYALEKSETCAAISEEMKL